ncbi:MAG TPA: CopG family transcriptional regulator [Terriglobia bacterium]|nr:CopG family transcriptional regulator [Terriglobia bacterium]
MKTAHKRATVYVDRHLHRALQRRAAESECSITTLVNDAVRMALLEDTEDLAAIAARRNEPDLDFEDVVRDMKRRGRL